MDIVYTVVRIIVMRRGKLFTMRLTEEEMAQYREFVGGNISSFIRRFMGALVGDPQFSKVIDDYFNEKEK